jgi:hypothetical protein
MFGPRSNEVAAGLKDILVGFDIPHVVNYVEDSRLWEIPGTVGLVLSPKGRLRAMMEYLQRPGKERKYLSVLTDMDGKDTFPNDLFNSMALEYGLVSYHRLESLAATNAKDDEELEETLLYVKNSGPKTIFLNTKSAASSSAMEYRAQAMERLGMLQDDYLYILSPELAPSDLVSEFYEEQEPGSPLDKLLSGALIFDMMDGYRVSPDTDPFLSAWRRRTSKHVDQLNDMYAPFMRDGDGDDETYFVAESDYFQTQTPANSASLVYDAIITVGIGGCHELEASSNTSTMVQSRPTFPIQGQENNTEEADEFGPTDETTNSMASGPNQPFSPSTIGGPPPQSVNDGLLDRPHELGMRNSEFHGASGRVKFGKEGRVRDSDDTTVGLYNIRPKEVNPESGKRSYEDVLTSLWNAESGWNDVPGMSFVYRDGTTVAPTVLRQPIEANYLSPGMRAIGLVLMSSVWIIGLFCMVSIYSFKNETVLTRAQPFFLQVLCVASILSSVSIYTISWDEGAGWSDKQLDKACMLTPWFFFVAHILNVSVMFTKLWRLDRVLQFRRGQTDKIHHVLGPLLMLQGVERKLE